MGTETPTSDQISDLRADIGDTGTPPAFSDADITRLWYRVRAARDEGYQSEAALALMARQLMTSAAKLHKYSAGNTSEDRQQVFDHLQKIYKMFEASLNSVLGNSNIIAVGWMDGLGTSEEPYDPNSLFLAE